MRMMKHEDDDITWQNGTMTGLAIGKGVPVLVLPPMNHCVT